MKSDLERPNPRSIRLKGYDYRGPDAYFVTTCVRKRQCLFGDVVAEEMVLNEFGTIVRDEWLKTYDCIDRGSWGHGTPCPYNAECAQDPTGIASLSDF